jgi:hypothetical protein
MRWKLVVLSSVAAAFIGVGLWSLLVILFFGTAWRLSHNDSTLLASALIPLGVAIFSGFFVYRHTARRRRLQAIITVLFSVLLIPLAYVAMRALFHERLYIPKTYDVRHAR